MDKEFMLYLKFIYEKIILGILTIIGKIMNSDDEVPKLDPSEFVPTGHFYSAVPSVEEREAYIELIEEEQKNLPGINLNITHQLELLNKFISYYNLCPFPDCKEKGFRYYFLNPAYSYTDALTLFSMIMEFKPKRIIEIGSGFSSCVMLDTNDLFFNGNIEITFIEPFPDLLESLIRKVDKKNVILANKLQNVDVNIFKKLSENDILFIDSTHVSKLNSDVNKIILEILPKLNKGVLIHFHDIYWPFDYPKDWIREGRAWNEAYLLRAFLEYNSNFEIIFFANYIHNFHGELIEKKMPKYLKNSGGNLWLKKIIE